MESVSERRKTARSRKAAQHSVRISFEQAPGLPKTEILAGILDLSDGGCRIKTSGPLAVGSLVYLDRSLLYIAGKPELWSARVVWCGLEKVGYTAGLELEAPAGASSPSEKKPPTAEIPDYYELLQLNAKADPDTIHRVYRMLAQRFHPDNPDTGDDGVFRRMLEAYRVISDPEQRAAYDVKLSLHNQHRWKIFDQVSALNGREAEKAKRTGMLLTLYTRRRNEPAQPAMTLHDMEELLGCPKEHLEFGLWYLKEKNFVARSDNGRFTITAHGVEAAEAAELPVSSSNLLMLPGK